MFLFLAGNIHKRKLFVQHAYCFFRTCYFLELTPSFKRLPRGRAERLPPQAENIQRLIEDTNNRPMSTLYFTACHPPLEHSPTWLGINFHLLFLRI